MINVLSPLETVESLLRASNHDFSVKFFASKNDLCNSMIIVRHSIQHGSFLEVSAINTASPLDLGSVQ